MSLRTPLRRAHRREHAERCHRGHSCNEQPPIIFKPRKFTMPERPRRTKHRITSVRCVDRGRRRHDQIVVTQEIMAMAIDEMREAGEIPAEHSGLALGWMEGLQECGDVTRLFRCPKHNRAKTVSHCCHCAICPREQRRRVTCFWTRLELLAVLYPDRPRGRRYTQLAEELDDPDVNDNAWAMITVSPKQDGTLSDRVDRCIDIRAKLWRLLSRRHGAHGAFAALEMGADYNVHFHMLVWMRYADRAQLQRWLRALDCTIEGCDHPADDRCLNCKREKHACTHPRSDRRPRCNGSWVIDIRRAYVGRGGRGKVFDPARGAIVEAIKYAISPVALDDVPKPGVLPTASQLEHAKRVVRFHLAIHNRKRIETYGFARPRQPEEDRGGDDQEPEDDGGAPRCPECNERMVYSATAERRGGTVEWFREPPTRRRKLWRPARAP